MRVVKQRLLEMLPDVRVFLDVDDLGVEPEASDDLDCKCRITEEGITQMVKDRKWGNMRQK